MPVGGPQDVGQEGVATGRGDFSLSSLKLGRLRLLFLKALSSNGAGRIRHLEGASFLVSLRKKGSQGRAARPSKISGA